MRTFAITSLLAAAVALIPARLSAQDAAPVVVDPAEVTLDTQWNGRKVVFLGDSIIDPRHVGTTICYWEYLKELLGMDAVSYAINGSTSAMLLPQLSRAGKEHSDGFDAIIISIGTNDYNSSVPLGEWYDVAYERIQVYGGGQEVRARRDPALDMSTFRGRLNTVMDYVRRTYPDKQVILLTPIHRGFARFNDTNVQPDERYSNRLGLFIDDYSKAVIECGAIWSAPVIDMFSESGLVPRLEAYGPMFHNSETDMLHPNSVGHYRMAKLLQYRLTALPAGF